MKKQKWMRKGRRVLAQFKTGTIIKAHSYELYGNRYVYLFLVQIDGEDFGTKFHPDDVEELTKKNL